MSRVGWLGSIGWLRGIGLGLRIDGGALVGHLGHVAVVVVRRVLKKVGSENIILTLKYFWKTQKCFLRQYIIFWKHTYF